MLYKGKETIGKWIVIVDSEVIESNLHWNFDSSVLRVSGFEVHTHNIMKTVWKYSIGDNPEDYITDEEFTVGCKFVEELTQDEAYNHGGNVLSKWLELQQEVCNATSQESSTSTNTITPPEDKTSENSLTELTMTSLQSLIDGLGIDATLCLHSISGVTTYEIYSEEELLNFSCKDINNMVEYLGKVKNLIDWRKSKGDK